MIVRQHRVKFIALITAATLSLMAVSWPANAESITWPSGTGVTKNGGALAI